MNLTYEQVVDIKNTLVKAQKFEMASWFRDEEKRLFATMPEKQKQQITAVKKAKNGRHWVRLQVNLPNEFGLLSAALDKLLKPEKEIEWQQTGKDLNDLLATPKRGHMLRVERLSKGIYWWAFYIGKSDFASYDVGDYGKSLEDAKEKCELYYYLHITK